VDVQKSRSGGGFKTGWIKSRCDLVCLRSRHIEAWKIFWCAKDFRRLTLRSATGLSQRDKHHHFFGRATNSEKQPIKFRRQKKRRTNPALEIF
jgi:hypothetical protein